MSVQIMLAEQDAKINQNPDGLNGLQAVYEFRVSNRTNNALFLRIFKFSWWERRGNG